ncbi:MAG: hypothetical protein JSS07_06230 [Proteobacteria bacterium]|nr:hypothetical protein [Pseudomonadota bacterium]
MQHQPYFNQSIVNWVATNDPELNAIIHESYQCSPLVHEAVEQQQRYSLAIYSDQQALLQQNSALFVNSDSELDIAFLQSQALARIERDIQYVQSLNQRLGGYSGVEPGEGNYTWSLKTNKMENILFNVKELISDTTTFSDLVQGHADKFDNLPPPVVVLGDPSNIYGNSQLTYLSGAILVAQLSLLGEQSKIQDVMDNYNNWVDNAAITHVTPLPDFLNATDIAADFTDNFSFYFSDELTPQGFAFIHSGYAFGGHRNETRYPDGKEFGPEDCSSWIAKLIGSEVSFSTIDQLFTYRMSEPEETRGYVDPDWFTSEYAKTMDILSPIHVSDPLKDVHPGQVFTFRNFDSDDHINATGTGGHTALVLGVRENGDIVTLNYSRNMPAVEGFGISTFSWQSTSQRETMFFEVKGKPLAIADVLQDSSLLSEVLEDNSRFDSANENLSSICSNNALLGDPLFMLPMQVQEIL